MVVWLTERRFLAHFIFWGDSDAVSPLRIPKYLQPGKHPNVHVMTYKTLKGAGHFLMLESPAAWSETIGNFNFTHAHYK